MSTNAAERARIVAAEPFHNSGSTVGTGPRRGFVSSLVEIFQHRELLRLLVGRELKQRYKDSSLGFLWTLIRPLIMLMIYYLAIGQVLGAARGVPEFAIFVFSGLTLWGLFSEIVSAGTTSIIGNGGLIKKVYLPREIFPIAAIGSALFNFAVQFLVLIVGAILLGGIDVNWNLLYIPGALAIVLVYGLAFALALSAMNVYLRDIQFLVEVGLLIFFWVSPIVYAWSFVAAETTARGLEWVQGIYLANPLTLAVMAFQRAIWADGSRTNIIEGREVGPQPWPADMPFLILVTLLIGLVLVWIAHRIFRRLEGNFAQEI
ncbi:ABC transporter permease [Microbacteriaceae bacterium VKM Ac-2855]|nr:ABC transporter permease [Microbacteriaceae bacterium VKM Ac-2855]